MGKINNDYAKNFFRGVLALRTEEECRAFFEDICTINELQEISRRLEVARLLQEGKVFLDINKLSGASSATISRVNRCVLYGNGGYELVLNRIREREDDPA